MADYFLVINGVKLPVLVRSRVSGSPVEIGSRAQMIDGTLMREVVGYRDHMWSCELGPFTAAEAAAVQRLIQGRGEYWPFDEDLYSATQLGPLSGAVATIHSAVAADGAPVVDAGRFGGSVAVEAASENLLTANQSDIETDTTGLVANGVGTTIARSTSFAWEGSASLGVVTPGNATGEGFITNPFVVATPSTAYAASLYVRGEGVVTLRLEERDASGEFLRQTVSAPVTLQSDAWKRISVSATIGADAERILIFLGTDSDQDPQAVTFYADGLQIEQADHATSWMLGLTNRAAGTLSYPPSIMPQDQFTFAAWWLPQVQVAQTVGSVSPRFFQLDDGSLSPGDRVTLIRQSGSQAIQSIVPNVDGTADTTLTLTPGAAYDADNWQFIACRVSGRDLYLRLNDEVQTLTLGFDPFMFSATRLSVGSIGTSGQLNGLLDDLIILPYAATDDMIEAWYETGHPFGPLPRLFVSGRLPDREIDDPVLCDGTVTGIRVGVEGRYLEVTLEQVTPSV